MSTMPINASCTLSLDFFICLFLSYLSRCAQIAESPTTGDTCHRSSAKCFFLLFFCCFIVRCRWWKNEPAHPGSGQYCIAICCKAKGVPAWLRMAASWRMKLWERTYDRYWRKGGLQWDRGALDHHFFLNNQSKCNMPHGTGDSSGL